MKERFSKFIPWIAGVLLFASLTRVGAEEVMQEVVVSPGETLWGIANKYLKDPHAWPEIVKYNDIKTTDPTVTLPGTRLKIPVLLIKDEYRNAQLVSLIPEVRYKRKGESDWKDANKDLMLHYEDSLRTMKGGQAHVRFPTKELVQINENTYVVLKPEKVMQQVELMKGEVRASRAKVIMPNGTVVEPKGRSSDYQARIRDDNTEVVFVYKGKVDVTAQGKTVTVEEGFGTEVPKFSAPKAPQPLAQFPDFDPKQMNAKAPSSSIITPMPSAAIKMPADNEKGTTKSKSISSKNILVSFTLQIAKDEEFKQVVYAKSDTIGSQFDFKTAKIPDGNYYMRVAFTDAFGVSGDFSVPSLIVKDTKPPVISNLVPRDGQQFMADESYCDIVGEVLDASAVSVNDEVVFIDSRGRFSKFMPLSEGANKIKILARDANGNQTLVERTVTYVKEGRPTR